MSFPRCDQDFTTYPVDIADHIVVPEPQDGEAGFAEMRVAPGVRQRFRMLTAVASTPSLASFITTLKISLAV